MSNMVTPKIEREAEARNYGKFVISPLERGYGVTVGNALRRILLSSLEGAAVTSIRISDVSHEFTDIPGVLEDVLRVMLNVKKLRLRLFDADTARLHLEVRGSGVITAADIIVPPEVEIINPDLYLFTVDDPNVNLEIEMTVERGRGYSPVEERSGSLPIGDLPVDAIFNPVRKVNWEVGHARVGQNTNYDKLILEIWTDGTITPEKALSLSARYMIEHLRHLVGVSEESLMSALEESEEPGRMASEALDIPIENLDLSVRVFNSLKRTGITTVGEVIELLEKGEDALLSIRNFGEKSLTELYAKLRERGYFPDEDEDEEETMDAE
ncbi:MAG TPA: DNA-directed RNA polymerase subunit alpha [Chloroflexi bacterium]|nr:DNA-directed RNA polymerase subunit alpha [Chloroflexota bacterium]